MRNFFKAVCLCVFFVSQLSYAETIVSQRNPDWAVPVKKSLNLFQVAPNFYRSEQMSTNDIVLIHQLGIKTVVSLRAFHDDDEIFRNTDIMTKRIPMYTWHVKDKEVIAALNAIHEAENQGPILLHCQHGADRTGMISAMYRMVYQGWDKEKAIQELMDGGYGYHAMWKNILKYLEHVDVDKIRQQLNVVPPFQTTAVEG